MHIFVYLFGSTYSFDLSFTVDNAKEMMLILEKNRSKYKIDNMYIFPHFAYLFALALPEVNKIVNHKKPIFLDPELSSLLLFFPLSIPHLLLGPSKEIRASWERKSVLKMSVRRQLRKKPSEGSCTMSEQMQTSADI